MCHIEIKPYLMGQIFGVWIEQTLMVPKETLHQGTAAIR